MKIVEVDEQIVDLSSTDFGITFKRIEIGNISSRFASYTTAVDIILNENSQKVFGHISSSANVSEIGKKDVKVINNGIEVLKGTLIPISIADGKIKTAIYDNFKKIIDAIKDKRVSECDPIPASDWTPAGIDSARLNTSGIVSVFLNWGMGVYNSNYFLPCFFYKTIIEKIFQFAGYTVSGEIFSDPVYTSLLIPFPGKFEYNLNDVSHFNGRAYSSVTINHSPLTGTPFIVPFDTIEYGSYFSSDRYTFPEIDYQIRCSIIYSGAIVINSWGDNTEIRIKLIATGYSAIDEHVINYPDATGGYEFIVTHNFSSLDELYVEVVGDGTTGDIDITFHNLMVTATTTPVREAVKWKFLLSDLMMTDIITDFFVRFGLIPEQTSTEVKLKTLEKIINDKHLAKELSDGEDVEIDLSNPYAKVNIFSYSGSSGLGEGTFSANSNLETKTIFKSNVKPTETTMINQWFVGRIPAYDLTSTGISDIKEAPGLRLLMIRSKYSYEPSITFNTTARSDYKCAYFIDESESADCGFNFFLSKYYPSFIEAVRNYRLITREYVLSDKFITELKTHDIVFDDHYYLINAIVNWVSEKKTKVELIRIF